MSTTTIMVTHPTKGLIVYDQKMKSMGIIASAADYNKAHDKVMVMYLEPVDIIKDRVSSYEIVTSGSKIYTINGDMSYVDYKNLQFKRKLSQEELILFDTAFCNIFAGSIETSSDYKIEDKEEKEIFKDSYNVDKEEDPILQSAIQFCNTIFALVDKCRNINDTLKDPIKLEAGQILSETEREKLSMVIRTQFEEARDNIYDELSSIMYNEKFVEDSEYYNKRIPNPEEKINERFSTKELQKVKREEEIIAYYLDDHSIIDTAKHFGVSEYSVRNLMSRTGNMRGRGGNHRK